MDFNNITSPQQEPIIPFEGFPFTQKSDLEIVGDSQNPLQAPLYDLTELVENKNLLAKPLSFTDDVSLLPSTLSSNLYSYNSQPNRDLLSGADISGQGIGQWDDPLTGGNARSLAVTNQLTADREIVFIDSTVDNYQSLLAGVTSGAEVVLLDATRDGVIQISEVLSQRNNITSVHIISHGSSGNLRLGTTQLTQENLSNYTEAIESWAGALTKDADILFYGCDVAEGSIGQAFVTQLSQLTGADVAASDDLTGNAQLGGDWNLEYAIGTIDSSILINSNYSSVLGIASLSNGKVIFNDTNFPGEKNNLSVSVVNSQLVIVDTATTGATQSTQQWKFALADVSAIEIKTGLGDDTIALSNLIFGKTVNLTINTGDNNDNDTITFGANTSFNTYGGNLDFTAESIILEQGAVISTRKVGSDTVNGNSTGNSGAIKFIGNVTIGSEAAGANVAKLLTHVEKSSVYQAGNITFENIIKGSFSPQLGFYNNDNLGVNIAINNAEIKAGDFKINASVDNSNIFETNDPAFLKTVEPVVKFLDSFALVAGVARTKSTASINISQASKIFATNLDIQASTTSLSATAPIGLTLGVGVGIIDAKSQIIVEGEITTTKNVSIFAKNDNTLKIFTESDPIAGGLAAAVAISVLDSDATAKVANTAKLNVGGDLNVLARTVSQNLTTALSATGEDGSIGVSVAISDEENSTNALVDGTVIVTGNTTIKADQKRNPVEVNFGATLLNGVNAGAGVNTNSRGNLLTDVTSGAVNQFVVEPLKKHLSDKTEDAAKKTKGQAQSLDLGAAVAIADYANNVTARIGAGANVKSNGEININAKVESRPDVGAGSTISDPSNGKESAPNQPAKVAISAAVAIGDYKNNAYAYIDNNATVNAQKALTVKAQSLNDFEFTYGVNLIGSLTTEPQKTYDSNKPGVVTVKLDDIVEVDDGHTTGGETGHFYQFLGAQANIDLTQEDFSNGSRWKGLGSAASYKTKNFVQTFTTYLDGNLGLDNNLGDSFTQSTAKGDKFALAGAVTILSLDQISRAYIGENAKINQDPTLRFGEQTITVEAISVNQAVNLIGNIETPGISGDIKKVKAPTLSKGGGGTEASNAVGGSVLVVDYTNDVTAKISKGVRLYGDNLKVNANTEGLAVSVAVSGGSAGTFGANGSVVVVGVDNTTTAQIEDGVEFTIGNALVKDEKNNNTDSSLVVKANDESFVFNIVGGVVVSNNVGIGASVGLNNINRQVNASIGNLNGSSRANSIIDSQGKIDIDANAAGNIITLSLAAAVVNQKKPESPTPPAQPTPGVSNADPLANESLKSDQQSNDRGNQGQYGIGISGDVSINTVTDRVRAFINDTGTIKTPQDIVISAKNDTNLIALSGSAAIVTKPEGTSVGLAGSVSVNLLTGETKAYVAGATLNAKNLSLEANREGDIFALSAAGAATASQQSFAVAGSVAVNNITNATESYIDAATVTLLGSLTGKAKDDSGIITIGGSLAYGGKAGVGASIAVNTIGTTTKAAIANTKTSQQGDLTLEADNSSTIIAITASIGASKTIGGAGTVSVNKINATTDALIDKTSGTMVRNVSVRGKNSSDIKSLAGAVGIGKTGGLGAAVAYNKITDNTNAHIYQSSLTIQGLLDLEANSDRTISTLSLGVAGGKTGALSGSVSINLIEGDTEAYIDGNSTIVAQDKIQAKALTDDEINAFSGGFAIASKTAIGAAVSFNEIKNATRSYVNGSAVTSQKNNMVLDARSTSKIDSLSVGGAGSGTVAVAGSVGINEIGTVVEAYISNNANVKALGTVQLLAVDDSHIASAAGQVAIGGKAGIGASVSTNNVNNRVNAYVSGSQVTSTANNVSLNANLKAKIGNVTVGGSGAGTFALGGSVTVNNINTITDAHISDNSKVNAAQLVEVVATDNSNIESLAGQVSIGGTAGIGASVSTNHVNNQAKAYISSSQVTANAVKVNANLTAAIGNITAGGAGGGTFAAGGSITVNNIGTTTTAYIGNNADVYAQQNIEVLASDSSTIKSLAGQVSAAGTAAIGAAVAVNNSNGSTQAYISDSKATSSTGQVKVTASNTSTIKSLSAGASVSGKVALTGSVSVNNINNTIDAHTFKATLTSNSVEISAKNNATIESLAGQLSISLAGGAIGAAVAYNNLASTVKAYAQDSTINTTGNVSIDSDSTGNIETVAAGGSAGLFVGLAGSVAVNQMSNNVSAYIQGGRLTAQGSVGVLANSVNTMSTKGGTFSAGIAGIGGTIAVNNISNVTQAYIREATVDALGNQTLTIPKADGSGSTEVIRGLAAIATSKENLTVNIGTGSAGVVGLAASIAVNSFKDTTHADISGGSINSNNTGANNEQSVFVKAFNNSKVDIKAGAAAVGGVGVGATIDVTTVKNGTSAFINNATVNALKDVDVKAKAHKEVNSLVVAAAGGAGLGVSGAVSVVNVSGGMSGDGLKAASDTKDKVNQQLSDLDGMGKDSKGNQNISTKKDIVNELSSSPGVIQGTTAFVSGTVNAGGQVSIIADETTKLGITSGAVALGGLLGAGGSVGIANITHDTSAYVGANANLTAGGNLTVQANGLVDSNKVTTITGTAGLVGLGAAVSYLTSKNNAKAYIGADAIINQANNVDVLAGSSSNLKAEGWGASLGAVAVGVVIANAEESGTTQAYLGNGVKIQNTNNLNVNATAKEAVSAVSQAASGGIVSGNGSVPTATVSPTVKAYVGDRSNINAANNVQIISDVTVDGDAEAKGISIGAIAVGVSIAEVNANPNIDTYVGAYSVINAKNVMVESRLGKPTTMPDTSFNPGSAVNNTKDTIGFSNDHRLKTGDRVVYLNGGGQDIQGLTNQQSYNVIRVDDKTVKLGSEFNAAEVTVKFNTIKFNGNHGFKDGDKVVYEAKDGSAIGGLTPEQSYYVKVIDSKTIKLTTNSSSSSITQGTGINNINTTNPETVITINNHGFQNGDALNYQQRSARFTVVKSIPQDAQGKDNIFNLGSDITENDKIKSASHGFTNGDRVIYNTTGTALGGLVKGQTYYAIKVDDNTFKLSTTQGGTAIDITTAPENTTHEITAVGLKFEQVDRFNFNYTDDSQNTNTITLNNHGFTTGQAITYQTSGTALSGLTSGTTYYIIKVDNNNFKLASSNSDAQNGTDINFGANDSSHQLVINKGIQDLEAGVPYYVVGADRDTFKLSSTKGGAALKLSKDNLTGTGVNHLFTKEDAIDLTSTSTGQHNLHIDLNSSTDIGSKHLLSTGASVSVPSQGDNKFSAYAEASAGALFGGNATLAKLNITSTMKTYVGDSASITATGDVSVTSLSSVEVTGATTSNVFGAIAVGASEIKAKIDNTNDTYVGISTQIKAGGNVKITGQSDQTLNVSGSGGAGSAITFANADAHATITHNTATTIKDGANITANDALLVRSSSNTNGNVKAAGDGVGLYADADADSSVKFDGSNATNINGNARLEGRSLTVEAVVDNLNVESRSEAEGAGAIGNIDAHAKVDLMGSDAIVNIGSGAYLKGDYVTLDAKYKTVNSNAIALADCDGLGGDTDTEATNIMPLTAKVFTDANSTLEVYKLNVETDFENFNKTTTADSDKAWEIKLLFVTITMDFGSESKNESYDPKPIIDFNSNVLLNRRDVNPVLVIDQNGTIVQKSENVIANITATDIIVSDINNTKVGEVNFIIPSRTDQMKKNGQFTDKGKYTVLDPAYDTVQIQNSSNKNLVINNISVINSVGTPQTKYDRVNVDRKTIAPSNLTPQNPLPVNPTIVTIENKGNSNLILQGAIDNPHDRTIIHSTGSIFRQGTSQKIITRDLTMTALNGSIGANGQRIAAHLNQGYTPVTADVISSNISLKTTAQNSIFLDLTAKQLDSKPVTVNVETMTASTGEVNLAIGQTTDKLSAAVPALYDFTKIVAGTDIVINAGTTIANIKGKTDFLNNTSFSDNSALTNIDGKTASSIKGLLDVVTGGYINLTEVAGGVNLRQAVSTYDSIQLTVTETASLGENLLLVDGAKVSAAKDITFSVADNFQINSTAEIKAGQNVAIKGDDNNQDPNGTLVNIFGGIYANSMEIYSQKDNDVFNIRRLHTKTTLRAAAGNDTINVGSKQPTAGGTLNSINAILTLSGGIGNDILNVDDSGDTANNIGTLSDTQIRGLGMGGYIDYGSFEELNLRLGSGSDILTVKSTHNGKTDIDTAAGNDVINIESIYGQTIVRAGSGNDNINVSNPNQMLQNINAILTLSGGIGSDILKVDDSGDTTNNIATLSDTQIRGLGMGGYIDYGSFEELNLRLGSGSDILTVKSNHNGKTDIDTADGNDVINIESIYGQTTVRAGSGNDNINVSNPNQMLQSINAILTLSGGIGSDTLKVDDSGDTTNNIATLSDTQIRGLGMGGYIDYGSFEELNLRLGSGSDILTVKSTHNGKTDIDTAGGNDVINIESIYGQTIVRAGSGNDNINVSNSNRMLQNINATLTLSGGIGSDTLKVDDSGDTANNIATLSDTQIRGLGMSGYIDYSSFEELNLRLGSGSDILTVKSTHNGKTNIDTAGGNDIIDIESIYGVTTVMTGVGDDMVRGDDSSLLAFEFIVDGQPRNKKIR